MEQEGEETKVLQVEANNWFTALRESLQALRDAAPLQNINFTVLDDGVSAEVHDVGTGRRFLIQAEGAAPAQPVVTEPAPLVETEERSTQAYSLGALNSDIPTEEDFVPPSPQEPGREPQDTPKVLETQTVPGTFQREERITLAQPMMRPQSFTVQGFYLPGTTDQFLTDAFMKLANLYEHFGNDSIAALRYVLNLVGKGVRFWGAGTLLADINDPWSSATFAVVEGPHADELAQLQISLSQGHLKTCGELLQPTQADYSTNSNTANGDFVPKVVPEAGSALYAPIQHHEQFLGAIVLYRKKGQGAFASGELSILDYTGRVVGEYLSALQDLST